MKKFVITEEEKHRILNLYEQGQTQGYSQFTQDFASMIGVPVEDVTSLESANENLDLPKRLEYQKLIMDQNKNIAFAFVKLARDGKLDSVLSMLKGYNKPMDKTQKEILWSVIKTTEKLKSTPKDQLEKYFQSNVAVNDSSLPETPTSQPTTTPSSNEKINTDHDRSYDYKLSGGKYYYTTKGQNNWVEAKGKRLEAIKSKVKF